jgi:hypothetical protein
MDFLCDPNRRTRNAAREEGGKRRARERGLRLETKLALQEQNEKADFRFLTRVWEDRAAGT